MSEVAQSDYDDSYATCVRTYSTLRIFSDAIEPQEISQLLRIEPTETFRKGDIHAQGRLRRKTNGWFFSTEKLCNSRDGRRHLDLILTRLADKGDAVKALEAKGSEVDITVYWASSGQGGPWLTPTQMGKLAALNIGIWWDVYFAGEHET